MSTFEAIVLEQTLLLIDDDVAAVRTTFFDSASVSTFVHNYFAGEIKRLQAGLSECTSILQDTRLLV